MASNASRPARVVEPVSPSDVAALRARALESLGSLDRSAHALVREYGDRLRPHVVGRSYNEFPDEVRTIREQLLKRGGERLVAAFHRCVLVDAIAPSRAVLATTPMLSELSQPFEDAVRRWTRRLFETADASLDVGHDEFVKDVSIATLRLWPAGAQVLEPRLGIPRRLAIQGGVRTLFGALRLYRELGGFRPLYEIHTYSRSMHEFSREGWLACYRRIARLLERDPDVKGIYGSAWFYDPQIPGISPQLAYLREEPTVGGAVFLRIRRTEETIALALSRDASRTQLFERGLYQPQEYLMVWPRARLVAWATSRPKD